MKKLADPWLKQEKAKYAQPIASRAFILSHIEQLKGRATYEQLIKALRIRASDKKKALKYRLTAMLRDKQLVLIGEEYRLFSEAPSHGGGTPR